jgi:hypothetical protein
MNTIIKQDNDIAAQLEELVAANKQVSTSLSTLDGRKLNVNVKDSNNFEVVDATSENSLSVTGGLPLGKGWGMVVMQSTFDPAPGPQLAGMLAKAVWEAVTEGKTLVCTPVLHNTIVAEGGKVTIQQSVTIECKAM